MPFLNVPGYHLVEYHEHSPGSPTFSLVHGNSHAERTFIVDWANLDIFAKGMLGFPKVVNTTFAKPYDTYISRYLPDSLPNVVNTTAPDNQPAPWLFAVGLQRVEGQGPTGVDNNDVATYQKAKVTVAYEPLTWNVASDTDADYIAAGDLDPAPVGPSPVINESTLKRYVTQMTRPMGEYLQLPRGRMKWFLTSPLAVDFATAVLLPNIEVTWTWHQVPFLPEALTAGGKPSQSPYIGTVNSADYTIQYIDGRLKTYHAGTLLLIGVDLKPYRMGSGAFVHDIAYRFKYFEPEPYRGHNYFLKYVDNSNHLQRIKITDTGANDTVAIPSDAAINAAGGSYAGYSGYTAGVAAGTAKSVFPYEDHTNLFVWHLG